MLATFLLSSRGHLDGAGKVGGGRRKEIVREGNEGYKRRMRDDRCNEEGGAETHRQRG